MKRQSYGERGSAAKGYSLYTSEGKKVAEVLTDQDGTPYLFKKVSGSRHFLRTVPGIAMDAQVVHQAQAMGCVNVKVLDRETGKTYTTTMQTVLGQGVTRNWGYGTQIALSFCWWNEHGADGATLKHGKNPNDPTKPFALAMAAQAPLFPEDAA